MKGMFDSAETFEAYATIDAAYFMMGELSKRMNAARSPIERLIDHTTGYSKEMQKEYCAEAVGIFEDMIAAKKFIEVDPEEILKDEQRLIEIRTMLGHFDMPVDKMKNRISELKKGNG